MAGARPRSSCRSMFKQLESLPVSCQYIFSLINFTVSNQDNVQTSPSTHNINTSNKHHLLSCYQNSTFYAAINIFNSLPRSVTILKNEKAKFKLALRKYLNAHCFYYVDEFVVCRDDLCYCFVTCV